MDEPRYCDLYQYYNIPHSFRIANHDFEVLIQDYVEVEGDYVYGTFSSSKQQILIATRIKTEKEDLRLTDECIRNSFWHEVFHCFNYFWNTDTDEGLAQSFANFMREYEITRK